MILNKAALDAIATGFRVIFDQTLQAATPTIERIATRIESTGADEEYPFGGLVSTIREWIGDRVYNNIAAWTKKITNRDWEHTLSVPRNHIADDRLGVYTPTIRQAAALWIAEPWLRSMEVLNYDAFGTDKNGLAVTGFDGKAFFAADHYWPSGFVTAQSNLATGDLTAANFWTAKAAMREFKNPAGQYLRGTPTILVVASNLEATAKNLFTLMKLASGSDNPTYGEIKPENIIVDPDIADGRWILLDTSKPIKPLIYQVRQTPQFVSMTNTDDEAVFSRKEFRFGADARHAIAALPWWLAYASDASATTTA